MSARLGCLRCGNPHLLIGVGETPRGLIPTYQCRCGQWTLSSLPKRDSAAALENRKLEIQEMG